MSAILLTIFVLFLVWYKYTFSMEVIEERSINENSDKQSVLIVSQGSEFKNKVIEGVIEEIEPRGDFLKVIDATALPNENSNEWDAMLIIHTMEIWQPQADVKNFLSKNYDPNKMIVFATSSSGEIQMEGIDGFTGASILEEVDERINQFTKLLIEVLEK
jgi:hypothetical protein